MASAQIVSLIRALPMPALFVDADQRIAFANEASFRIWNEGITGRHYTTALRSPSVLEAIEACHRSQEPQKARFVSREGRSDTHFDLHCAWLAQGEQGVLITLIDVSDLETSEQLRSDFVANVSHELRTPLTAVMGFIETLQTSARDDPDASARFLEIMATETARMNRLVDDLLSLSRVEAQERSRPHERVEIDVLLGEIVAALQPIATREAARLSLVVQTRNKHIRADSDQLRQVFGNLIENALKYGGEGVGVTVTLHKARFETRLRGRALRISIRDTGEGFEPIHIPRLTERFYRIDAHRSRETGGTGLGLAIAKHIIHRHRGHLEIQSKVEQGSEFTVILPDDLP